MSNADGIEGFSFLRSNRTAVLALPLPTIARIGLGESCNSVKRILALLGAFLVRL